MNCSYMTPRDAAQRVIQKLKTRRLNPPSLIPPRLILILMVTLFVFVYITANRSTFDGTASHRIPEQALRAGYWEGLQHYYMALGPAGVYEGKNIRTNPEKSGGLVHGPFITLPPGNYRVCFEYKIREGNPANFTVQLRLTADKGGSILAEQELRYTDEDIGDQTEYLEVILEVLAEYAEMQLLVHESTHLLLTKTEIIQEGLPND